MGRFYKWEDYSFSTHLRPNVHPSLEIPNKLILTKTRQLPHHCLDTHVCYVGLTLFHVVFPDIPTFNPKCGEYLGIMSIPHNKPLYLNNVMSNWRLNKYKNQTKHI
jgi:hypothetical protein